MIIEDKKRLEKINQNIKFFEKRIKELSKGTLTKEEELELKRAKQSLLANLMIKNRIEIANKAEYDVMRDVKREYRNVLAQIKQNIKQIYSNMMMYKDEKKVRQYQALLKEEKRIYKMIEDNLRNIENLGINKLEDSLKEVFHKQAGSMEEYLKDLYGFAGSFAIIRPEVVRMAIYFPFAGDVWTNRWKRLTDDTVRELRNIVTRGIIRGDSVEDVTKLAGALFESKGIKNPISRARTLVRTEIHRIMTQANEFVYDNLRTNIKGWLYMATLDNATCVVCGGYDGMYFEGYDAQKPVIPQHPNCRCEYLPVFYGQDPYDYARGYRNLKTGKWETQSKYLSYRTYLKRHLDEAKNVADFENKYPKLAKQFSKKALEKYYKTGDINAIFNELNLSFSGILPGTKALSGSLAGKDIKRLERIKQVKDKYLAWQGKWKEFLRVADNFEKNGILGPHYDLYWEAKRNFREFYETLHDKAKQGFKKKFLNDWINRASERELGNIAKKIKDILLKEQKTLSALKKGQSLDSLQEEKLRNFLKGWKDVFGFQKKDISKFFKEKDLTPIIKQIDRNTVRRMIKQAAYEGPLQMPVDFLYEASHRNLLLSFSLRLANTGAAGAYLSNRHLSPTAVNQWERIRPAIWISKNRIIDKDYLAEVLSHELGHFADRILVNSPSVRREFFDKIVKGHVLPVPDNYDVMTFYGNISSPLFWTERYLGISSDKIIKASNELVRKGVNIGGFYAGSNFDEIISTQFQLFFGEGRISAYFYRDTIHDEIKKNIVSYNLLLYGSMDKIKKQIVINVYKKEMNKDFKKFIELFTRKEFITV